MGDRKRTVSKVSLGMLKVLPSVIICLHVIGKPMSTSVPTFRFHAGEEEIEQIYPEIEEENLEKEESLTSDTLTVSPPIAPPRTPKHGRSPSKPHSGIASAGEVSPVHTSLSTGSLNKRSTSMDGVDAPGHNSGWGLFTDLRGKIVRTVEEMKSERQRAEAPKLNSSQKDNTSFSDSEEASSSESNQIPSCNLSTSDSVSQLSGISGMSSLSTTPTTPSTVPLSQKLSQSSGKWHHKFLGDRHNEEEKTWLSRPTTPVKSPDEKGVIKSSRAGSVPLVLESSPVSSQKRCTSLRSRFRPKMSELRKNRRKISVDSRSNSSLSSALYVNGDETDDDVESGVEALEEPWEDAACLSRPPSTPLGDSLMKINGCQDENNDGTVQSFLLGHKYIIFLSLLLSIHWTLSFPSAVTYVGVGILLVLGFQEERQALIGPTAEIASMHMGNKPFEIPDYSSMPTLQVPAAKEILPTDSFQGWMNELNGVYDTKSYHISMTESVHVRLDGSCLTLSHTRTKVPKRAMWNEHPIRNIQFTDERLFDLRGWQVKLLPDGITRRRQWSKKYPICLVKCDESEPFQQDELSGNEEGRTFKNTEKDAAQTRSNVSLTTAKYAKSSTSAESLEFLPVSGEDQKDISKMKYPKSDNFEEGDKLSADGVKVFKDYLEKDTSDVDDDSFCVISTEMASQNCICLFARADREKEEWYRRFAEAVRENEVHCLPVTPLKNNSPAPIVMVGQPSLSPEEAVATMGEYLRYMQQYYLEHKMYPSRPKPHSTFKDDKKSKDKEKDKDKDKDKDKEKDKDHDKDHIDTMIEAEEQKAVLNGLPMSWLNAIIGRICFDLLRSPTWQSRILQRLQKKLSTLKLPYFMEALTITELDLGNTVPVFHRASQPSLDVRGLWFELDMTYQGNFRMTIESKLNLMKLKRSAPEDVSSIPIPTVNLPPLEVFPATVPDISMSKSPAFDSDLDDSAESSSDDDTSSINTEDGIQRTSTSTSSKRAGKKLLRMVDKIAASKYFQQATEMKYIKKAMEGVSNTRIMLAVELKGLVGTLAVNIPPPPSDRLWYGFHGNPKLWLSAHPTLGERQVNFYHISNWIEQKLCQEFQKVLVLPNMDDIVIPVMSPHLPV
ncbi:Testis-expressed protein 2 [Frankliniella fusca]|uniref:Testis-expressed protein 2 n=1 Tax=Frankliniella fusca TaxID=407009 RepID=A0AAE1HXM0_9NEOP|nr:Testis-expressed protein 2 [Frankliniella fusca]